MRHLSHVVAAMQPLRQAAYEGNLAQVKKLCKEKGANVNEAGPESGRTALHWSALAGSNAVVSYLLKAKRKQAMVDPFDSELNTPLNVASQVSIQAPIGFLQKRLAVIYTLLAHGADATLVNGRGKTPLMNLVFLRDHLPESRYFLWKTIQAMIVKIQKIIHDKAEQAGQVACIHADGQVTWESKVYNILRKKTYAPHTGFSWNTALHL